MDLFYYFILLIAVISASCAGSDADMKCASRDYGHGSVVCVCNATYCDTITTTRPVPYQSVSVFTSTKGGHRFSFSVTKLSTKSKISTNNVVITLNKTIKYQTIKGFGGAITDAATVNIKNLTSRTQEQLIKAYFGPMGIEYNLGRVPMASCDYSTRKYTYLDTPNDFNLSTFELAKEDMMLKIPVLKSIHQVSSRNISLYASPWTAPAWMKTNNDEIGRGWLKGTAGDKYHKTWAQYFIKFFEEYKKQGITFWGVTAQNEPSNGLLISSKWQSTGFTPEMQRDFIKSDLGPALKASEFKNVKLMILDDQRLFLPSFPLTVLSDKDAAQYVSGIGIHWYWDWLVGPEVLADTHEKLPGYFMLATEACNKDTPQPDLGNWETGEKYSNDILDNLNNWAVGWVDWNLCLNLAGGPNWAQNFDDSPIITNATGDEFYKQPMYYHMGHFSKFLVEESVRIKSTIQGNSDLKFVAVERPDGSLVLVVLNSSTKDVTFNVVQDNLSFTNTIPANAIQTFSWSDK
uniref:Glucosylceramidase n=1 Tax=Phallusia mammillata TaxID=59560 RepID=A0A6F9DCU0_9ASCI|nr:glucosylceramidase-like [Phallusia mammillata]